VSPPTFAVFDIDGVLADVRHRLHHVRGARKNWAAFFAAASQDTLLPEGRHRLLAAAEHHPIVYLSGRPERLRQVTQTWLDAHLLPAGALVLRPNHDRRPARVLKPALLERVAQQGEIAVVVDDDPEVVDVLRTRGLAVELATWAADAPELRAAQDRHGRS
jgi:phosphoglycolate phosphatase-like HAD superfamily hydrolase